MTELECQVEQLSLRVRELEDFVEISTLVATYAPALDSDSREVAAALWTEDGAYDLNHRMYKGWDGIRADFLDRRDMGWISKSAHPSSAPRITIKGDEAVVTNYQHLVRLIDDEFRVVHQNASVWRLVRTASGWRVRYRTIRETDGSGQSQTLLQDGLNWG
jgi:SnoaL-like domain